MARNQTVVYRAPKRRVERVGCVIAHSITNGTATKVLHDCEDRKTLVRAILQLHVVGSADGGNFQILLHREPKGTSIANPALGESLDEDLAKEEIWRYQAYAANGSTDAANSHTIFVDLSSMRKLDPGDEVVLKTLGAGAATAEITGIVNLFFKE